MRKFPEALIELVSGSGGRTKTAQGVAGFRLADGAPLVSVCLTTNPSARALTVADYPV